MRSCPATLRRVGSTVCPRSSGNKVEKHPPWIVWALPEDIAAVVSFLAGPHGRLGYRCEYSRDWRRRLTTERQNNRMYRRTSDKHDDEQREHDENDRGCLQRVEFVGPCVSPFLRLSVQIRS
jgi:hypothetical protein